MTHDDLVSTQGGQAAADTADTGGASPDAAEPGLAAPVAERSPRPGGPVRALWVVAIAALAVLGGYALSASAPDEGTPQATSTVPPDAAPNPTVATGTSTTLSGVRPEDPADIDRASDPLVGSAVVLRPGDDVQAIVDSHPEGTTFFFSAGTYRQLWFRPRSGQVFIGERGPGGERLAVLDGEDVTPQAIIANGMSGVTIRGLSIIRYPGDGVSTAAINTRFPNPGFDWVIEDNEVAYSHSGIYPASRNRVVGNYIHHNRRYGMAGQGADLLVEDNEIAYNRTDTTLDGGDSSATKFVVTSNLVLRGNWVHDNQGNGLWVDINNYGTLVEDNLVEDNWWVGIFEEISYEAVIRNNVVTGNGIAPYHWTGGAGILVANSPDVEVYGNTVAGNSQGILGFSGDRETGESTRGPWELRNLYVHDNVIVMEEGATGIYASHQAPEVFTVFGNRFESNQYTLSDPNGRHFVWDGWTISMAGWEAYGQS